MKWFEVDKQGLGKLLERRGKQFIIYELVQNAWDENTTRVEITLERNPGTRYATLRVSDDNPDGFKDLSHAFTLFAESTKKGDAEKRGRFNLGEKLVLALCEEAKIETTTGTVIFDVNGRRHGRSKTARGSVFHGVIKMTNEELQACHEAAEWLIPPMHITTLYNGNPLRKRERVEWIENVSLATEYADSDGILRRTARQTTVEIFEPVSDEIAMLYEMGIPVVPTGDRWHVNVGQKVPLNFDRDNVTPAYLGQVRALVTQKMADALTTEDANATWVRDALERHGEEFNKDTVERLVDLRFGEKRVAYDPSDPEANSLAVSRGFTVVHGKQLSRAEWEAVRRTGTILPAGQVTPSPKPFHPDGKPLKTLDRERFTPGIIWFEEFAKRVASEIMGKNITVRVANDFGWPFLGAYGPSGTLFVNVARAGYRWFEENNLASINDFLIHEFGHQYCGNHLDEKYHEALTMLGGKLSVLALEKPEIFRR